MSAPPYLFHENFETGTAGGFEFQSDPEGRMDFPDHNDGLDIPPWRGAYVMRLGLNRGVVDAFAETATGIAIGSGTNRYVRFNMYVSRDFYAAPDTSIRLLSAVSSSNPAVEEASIGITRQDSQIHNARLGVRSPDDSEFINGISFELGKWFSVETAFIHNGINTSRCYLHVGDYTVQVNRMSFNTFTGLRLGAMSQSAKMRGTIYIDDFILNGARLFTPQYIAPNALSGQSVLFTKTSYLFVGPGRLRGATLIAGGNDNQALFFDTDKLPYAHHDQRAALKCAVAESKDSLIEEVEFKKGCYMVLTGTNPQVQVHYGKLG